MRIGVDCHVIQGKFQGSRTYLWNLYDALTRFRSPHDFLFFGQWHDGHPFGCPSRHVDYYSASRWKRLTFGTRPLIKQHDIELFHSTYISPLLMPCRQILTIHDILFETHPQFFKPAFVYRSRLLVRFSARRATQIHTISRFTQEALIDIYGIEPEKIKLVPVGVNLDQFNSRDRSQAADHVAHSIGLRDYILTVGRLEPRKNQVALLEAYSVFRRQCKDAGPLLIVGQRDFNYSRIFECVQRNNLSDCVHFLETVNDELLADIYKGARLFVYPSLAEGFGIPPLEAMASGVPVITSNCTAIPEVAAGSSILVEPEDIEMIADAMHRLYTDENLRRELSKAGSLQAKNWTWQRAAQAYLKAVDEIDPV